MNTKKFGFFSPTAAKLIAIAAMSLDHWAWINISLFTVQGQIFHGIGRITMPVMCYFAALGYSKTKNVLKYILRLLAFGVIAQPFFWLCFDGGLFPAGLKLDVMFTIAISVAVLWLFDDQKLNPVVRYGTMIGLYFFSMYCDWSYWCVIMCLLFYRFAVKAPSALEDEAAAEKLRRKNAFLVLLSVAVMLVVSTFFELYAKYGFDTAAYNSFYRSGVLLAAPLICFCTNIKAKNSFIGKWFFYLYYPLHLAVLWLLFLK